MNNLQNKKHNIVVLTSYFIAFFLGIETGGLQYSVLKMAEEFHLNSAQMGSIVSVYFFATMVSPIFTGALSDRIGKKKVITFSILVFIVGCLITSFSGTLIILYAGVCVVGLAFSATESSATAALTDYCSEKSGRNISIMQSVFSAGCFVSPMVVYFLMDNLGFDWRVLFYMCLVLAVIALVLVIFTKFTILHADVKPEEGRTHGCLKIELYLIVMVLCISVYQFMENGITFFADLFISINLGSPDAAALAISFFWAAMAVARFLGGCLYRYENLIIKVGFIVTAGLLLSLSFVESTTVALMIYLLLGISCGPLWPLVAGKAIRAYQEHSGLVTGMVLIAGGLGGTISPSVVGMINDMSNMTVAFMFLACFAVIGMLMFTVIQLKKKAE